MRKHLVTSILFTLITTVGLGIFYPLFMTVLAQTFFHWKANGEMVSAGSGIVGSRLIGQAFDGPGYFHGRPSAAGANGYDASASGGSNYGPTNAAYVTRAEAAAAASQKENPGVPVPVDLVTASGSGLDPDITPAAAGFQIPRVARARGISVERLKELVAKHTLPRQFGILGEPRVNVLELNLDLDRLVSKK